jgi:hypothetical protein
MSDSLQAFQQLNESIERDIEERTKIHQITIGRLKARMQLQERHALNNISSPLVMLAHGDSWFNYPLSGNGPLIGDTDIIAQLRCIGSPQPVILNISHFGDAASTELSLPKQLRMIDALRNPNNWLGNGLPDAILFSGGGNDIVGDPFCIWLDYNVGGATGLNRTRFDEAIGMVEACYRDLFAFRDQYAPGVPIFGHCYDYPFPNGVHPVCVGPWLKPGLDFCGWDYKKGREIITDMLMDFRTLLRSLQAGNNFTLVETQGLLPQEEEWANELHLYPQGFKTLATKFMEVLRQTAQFHGRI